MGYPHHPHHPHVQSSAAMGGGLEPKFPPSEEYHHYNGYSMGTAGMTQTSPGDYLHHQTNGLHQNSAAANFSYSQGFGSFYHHHHHHHPPPPPPPSSGYGSPTAAQMHGLGGVAQNNSYANNGYYSPGYYGSTAATNTTPAAAAPHQMLDLPIQCPPVVEPTNTALGLQELGEWSVLRRALKSLVS
jgi:hypothetical protein